MNPWASPKYHRDNFEYERLCSISNDEACLWYVGIALFQNSWRLQAIAKKDGVVLAEAPIVRLNKLNKPALSIAKQLLAQQD